MNAEISKKFAAFTVAMSMTGLITTGVAYTFNVPLQQRNAGSADSSQRQCGCTPGRADYCQCEATAGLL
jgi:hypothetical protein